MSSLEQDVHRMATSGIVTTKNKIPVTLKSASEVRISLYDITGTKVADLLRNSLGEGDHDIEVDGYALGIPEGNYVYQAEIINNEGTEKYCRIVSVAQ
ncbi:MAG: hypothetical protein KF744_13755 [Taibaiella sp.]|nr:hypothetical protein [Taibaiella sp.]